jgi:UTP-glucose-1-phosphate uridylyltransferase
MEVKKAIIPVAGLGTRFLPLSRAISKDFFPLVDKPVIQFIIEEMKVTYMFYDSGLSINVIYSLPDVKKRAVGLKLSENMKIPAELVTKFKFGRQKSKLAGIIRGSYFIIKNEY